MSDTPEKKQRPLVTLKGVGTIAATDRQAAAAEPPAAAESTPPAPPEVASAAPVAAAPVLRVPAPEAPSSDPVAAEREPGPEPEAAAWVQRKRSSSSRRASDGAAAHSPFWPIFLGLLSLGGLQGLLMWNGSIERAALTRATQQQQEALVRLQQSSTALENLEREVRQLATRGHPLAVPLAQQLARQRALWAAQEQARRAPPAPTSPAAKPAAKSPEAAASRAP
jgi:hypothetical protein